MSKKDARSGPPAKIDTAALDAIARLTSGNPRSGIVAPLPLEQAAMAATALVEPANTQSAVARFFGGILNFFQRALGITLAPTAHRSQTQALTALIPDSDFATIANETPKETELRYAIANVAAASNSLASALFGHESLEDFISTTGGDLLDFQIDGRSLTEYADTSISNPKAVSLAAHLLTSSNKSDADIALLLLKKINFEPSSEIRRANLMSCAIESRNISAMESLLNFRFNTNSLDSQELSALDRAASLPHNRQEVSMIFRSRKINGISLLTGQKGGEVVMTEDMSRFMNRVVISGLERYWNLEKDGATRISPKDCLGINAIHPQELVCSKGVRSKHLKIPVEFNTIFCNKERVVRLFKLFIEPDLEIIKQSPERTKSLEDLLKNTCKALNLHYKTNIHHADILGGERLAYKPGGVIFKKRRIDSNALKKVTKTESDLVSESSSAKILLFEPLETLHEVSSEKEGDGVVGAGVEAETTTENSVVSIGHLSTYASASRGQLSDARSGISIMTSEGDEVDREEVDLPGQVPQPRTPSSEVGRVAKVGGLGNSGRSKK